MVERYAWPRSRPIAAILALGLLAAGAVPAALAKRDRKEGVDPAVLAVLERMDRAQKNLKSFQADVVETRSLAVLDQPETLQGKLTFEQPGRVRWEYTTPEARVYVLDDGKLTGWIPSKNRVEKLNVSRRESRIRKLIAVGQGADALLKDFDITLAATSSVAATDELVLVPDSRRVRKRIQEIRLWVDAATGMPRQVRWKTGDGDSVQLALNNLQLNPLLAADTFKLTVPANAEVVDGISGLGVIGGKTSDADSDEL